MTNEIYNHKTGYLLATFIISLLLLLFNDQCGCDAFKPNGI